MVVVVEVVGGGGGGGGGGGVFYYYFIGGRAAESARPQASQGHIEHIGPSRLRPHGPELPGPDPRLHSTKPPENAHPRAV